jgi:hypothetical protein
VFEFVDNEKKANFENESHCYVHQDNNNTTIFTAKAVQHFDIAFDIAHRLNLSTNGTDKNFNSFSRKYFSPPDRLFLLHSSLLI